MHRQARGPHVLPFAPPITRSLPTWIAGIQCRIIGPTSTPPKGDIYHVVQAESKAESYFIVPVRDDD